MRRHADMLRQDVAYALRTLRRSPGFALTAMLLTAAGVGATTAAVAVADHVLLRPLPFHEPHRLARFWQQRQPGETGSLSPANYRDLTAAASSFESIAAYTAQPANLTGRGAAVRLDGQRASGELFDVLGRRAALGSVFSKKDEAESAPRVVVLSHRAWTTYFGSEPGVIGQRLTLNGVAHAVIGVMPPDFMFPDRATEFWVPLTLEPAQFENRSNTFLMTVARLRPGRSIEQADAELDATAAELARRFPVENARLSMLTRDLRGELGTVNRTTIKSVAGAAMCLLLIAATNLAGLLLSRGLSRRRELAVRAAIGADRRRLIRQMLTESCLLGCAGSLAGVAVAIVAAPLLARLVPTMLPIPGTPALDWRFALIAVTFAMLTAATFGTLPARRAAAGASPDALRESARTGVSRRTERLRGALVIAQVAVSVLLLVSVGLLARALWRVQSRDPGFDAANAITMRTTMPWPKYATAARRTAFYDRVLGEIRALPGVESAGYVTGLPMLVTGLVGSVTPEGHPPANPRENLAAIRFATPGYLAAMEIPLREGRDLAASDAAGTPFVAVVSESLAKRHWPGQSAVGRRFTIAGFERTIVGITGDVRVRGLERQSEPQVYLPPTQVADNLMPFHAPKDLVVRTPLPAAALLPHVREIVARADPELPISDVRALAEVVGDQTAARETQVGVLTGFAAIALIVATIGLYGLLSFGVSSRVRDIGLRMALGATPSSVVGLVVRRAAWLAAAGIAAGGAGAYGVGRWMESTLAGVSPADGAVFGAAIAVAVTLAIAGSLMPAIRASRISPLEATRE